MQSYLGINTSDVTSDRFMATTGKFISTSIGVLSRTDVRVSELNPTPERRLAGTLEVVGVPVEFTVNVTSGMTPVEVIAKMQRSMDQGEFLDIVANDLGLSITNTTRAYFIDVTDEEPSAAPSGPIVPRGDYTCPLSPLLLLLIPPPLLLVVSFLRTVTLLLTLSSCNYI